MTVAQTVDISFDANGNKVKEVVSGTSASLRTGISRKKKLLDKQKKGKACPEPVEGRG